MVLYKAFTDDEKFMVVNNDGKRRGITSVGRTFDFADALLGVTIVSWEYMDEQMHLYTLDATPICMKESLKELVECIVMVAPIKIRDAGDIGIVDGNGVFIKTHIPPLEDTPINWDIGMVSLPRGIHEALREDMRSVMFKHTQVAGVPSEMVCSTASGKIDAHYEAHKKSQRTALPVGDYEIYNRGGA